MEIERTAFISFIEKDQVSDSEFWIFFKTFLNIFFESIFQEVDGTRTSNGIQYRLQLLYSNGELIDFDFDFS